MRGPSLLSGLISRMPHNVCSVTYSRKDHAAHRRPTSSCVRRDGSPMGQGSFLTTMMKRSDPTKDPEFKRVLGNLLKAPPKPHSEMKIGKRSGKQKPSPRRGKKK